MAGILSVVFKSALAWGLKNLVTDAVIEHLLDDLSGYLKKKRDQAAQSVAPPPAQGGTPK